MFLDFLVPALFLYIFLPKKMENFEQVGIGFTTQYYNTFQSNRAALSKCYRSNSLITYNGEKLSGADNILQKLTNLPMQNVQFQIQIQDCHPSLSGGVLVFVDGDLRPDGEEHSLRFAELFHLAREDNNSWYISNQIFRIMGGGSQ